MNIAAITFPPARSAAGLANRHHPLITPDNAEEPNNLGNALHAGGHDILAGWFAHQGIARMYRALLSAADETLRVARTAASQVICLPIYPELETANLERIVSLISDGASWSRPAAGLALAGVAL